MLRTLKVTNADEYGLIFIVYILLFQIVFVPLPLQTKHVRIMTAIELNAQIWRDMATIADSEPLMKQLARYLKKLVAKKEDDTLMTKEEFFAKLERAEEEYRQGKCDSLLPDEDLTTYLRRRGYDI